MSMRLYESLRAALAMVGVLFCLTAAVGGFKLADPQPGWSLFFSGGLWIGLPVTFGVSRWIMGASKHDRP